MTDLTAFSGKDILVTGGAGFIGSNLARRLVELGAQVTLVDSLVPEYGGNVFNIAGLEDKLTLNISDVRDAHSMQHLIQGKDYLFNLAGQTSHMDSMRDPQTDLEINCRAQLSILEACRSCNPRVKIVFASTRQIYGKPTYLPVDEKHLLRPVDVNGVNKMAGEAFHILYHDVHGIRACALRLSNTIGPGMRIKDARQTFLGIWIRLLIENKPFEVWGGEQLRDFTYIDDAVDALLLAAQTQMADGKIYNLGGPPPVTLHELADLLVQANGGGNYSVCTYPSDRKVIDIGDYYADFSAIKSDLGWNPRVSLSEALKRTLAYYQQNYAHYV
jgi:UDP-glucose 4-epimerase